jgi:hypothetical protein
MVRMVRVGALILLGAVLAFNGAMMLLAPRHWFRLPTWLGFQGTLTEKRYGGGGAISVRLTGAAFLAAIGWVVYGAFIRR